MRTKNQRTIFEQGVINAASFLTLPITFFVYGDGENNFVLFLKCIILMIWILIFAMPCSAFVVLCTILGVLFSALDDLESDI